MRKIVYTEEELKINKVLKMNQDMSMSLLSDSGLKASRAAADDNIASSLALLESLHRNTDTACLSSQFGVKEKSRGLSIARRWKIGRHWLQRQNLMSPIL